MTIDPHIASALEAGLRHERSLDPEARKAGAHFTPAAVAAAIVDDALDVWGRGVPLMCDPSCGGGVFLVMAAEALWRRGVDPTMIVESSLLGFDVDPGAVDAARAGLEEWVRVRGRGAAIDVNDAVGVRDALDGDPWASPDGRCPDIVVGNPPFRSQLSARTARGSEERSRLVSSFGEVVTGYVDVAAIFAVAAVRAVPPGGVVALVLPRSVVAARDASPARHDIVSRAPMVSFWAPGEKIFEAAVDVIVPLFHRSNDGGPDQVVVRRGDDRRHQGAVSTREVDAAGTWSPLWATVEGLPPLDLEDASGRRCVADVARTTAGFRDHYYAVVEHLDERPTGRDPRRLLTTAMVDPGLARWGEQEVTVARRRRRTPWVDLAAVAESHPTLIEWCRAQSHPKVLVATQTRVIEAVADPRGDFVPLTPIISVHPTLPPGVGDATRLSDVGSLAAALSAPPAALWALRMFGGGGMSRSALKLAARQVGRIPLPTSDTAWDEASRAFTLKEDWAGYAASATRSWGLNRPDIDEWWLARLSGRSG